MRVVPPPVMPAAEPCNWPVFPGGQCESPNLQKFLRPDPTRIESRPLLALGDFRTGCAPPGFADRLSTFTLPDPAKSVPSAP